MIYKVTWDYKAKEIISVPDGDFFKVPTKLYGDTKQRALRVWNDYVYYGKSTGCLLTGDQGTGKTLLGQLISNIAIEEKGMPIYMVTIKPNEGQDITPLIEYLNNLRECVIFIDEFAKMIKYKVQDQFLTMLSDLKRTKKIFILTENDTYDINRFILNRPGRIKYHFDYTKINSKVLIDYCKDKNVSDSFIKDLLNKHDNSNIFSFDQLEAIVDEHKKYPSEPLKDILDVLNLSVLRFKVKYNLSSVFDKRKQEYVEFKPMNGLRKRDVGLELFSNVVIEIIKEKQNNEISGNQDDIMEALQGKPTQQPETYKYVYHISNIDKQAIARDDSVVLTTPEYIITYIKEK